MKKNNFHTASGAAFVSAAGDMLLALIKTAGGAIFSSSALFSDGIHSCTDFLMSLTVYLGAAGADGRKNVPKIFKREKASRIIVYILSAVLFLTGLSIGASGLYGIITGTKGEIPKEAALCVSVFAFSVKEALFVYTRLVWKRSGSALIYACSWHHQSDALSCLGSFTGILGARLGFPVSDSIASVIICVFIVLSSIEIIQKSNKKLGK